jgi:hypothetical protein
MSLRTMLGADTDRVHEQVDALLDSEDGVIVLIDRSRAISYAHGFGISPCQLESLMVDIERTVRNVGASPIDSRRNRRNYGEERKESDDSGRDAGIRRHLDRLDHGGNGRVVDRRTESVRTRGAGDSNSGIAAGRVLRLAREAAATDVG